MILYIKIIRYLGLYNKINKISVYCNNFIFILGKIIYFNFFNFNLLFNKLYNHT
jgi:hypothetical protein